MIDVHIRLVGDEESGFYEVDSIEQMFHSIHDGRMVPVQKLKAFTDRGGQPQARKMGLVYLNPRYIVTVEY